MKKNYNNISIKLMENLFTKWGLKSVCAFMITTSAFVYSVQAQTTIYSTNFGTVANVNPAGWTFTGVDMNISTNTPSSGYTGASGGAYLGEGNSTAFVNTSGTAQPSSQIGTSEIGRAHV